MVDEKPNKYEFLPIPTYEEATSSRPSSSNSHLGPEEVSHDAERQGLLGRGQSGQFDGYQPPTVQSARSSLDSRASSGAISHRSSVEALQQREIQQMEVEEPGDPNSRAQRFSKRLTSLTHSLSSINLPFRQWLPSGQYMRARIPSILQGIRFQPNWIIVSRIFAVFLVLFIIWLFLVSGLFTGASRRMGNRFDPDSLRKYVQAHIDADNIRQNLQRATQFDHIAGTKGDYFLATELVEKSFLQAGLENVVLERFDVYLNYPKQGGRRVAIIDPPELAWEAKIEEELAYPPEFEAQQTMVFHGHSKTGNVTGPLIYANFGSRQDFQDLKDRGIDVKGSVVIVRYYGSQPDRSLKVKGAELAGAVGCIIYSDPAEDGFIKGEPYPKGRFMPSDGVQRGSVAMSSWVVGDVLSPGFASLPGERRRDSKENNPGLQNIPSIPLAWRDAQRLLQALKGHGKKIEDSKAKGGIPEVEWWTGDSNSPTVHLMNDQIEKERKGIYNVLGKITGVEQPEKSIIVGNHRDAWCFGGADPGSGTAIMLEVVRVLGDLRRAGWRPLRSIEFASWDGEEYNMIGSTEHVEARITDLRRDALAYLNVDVAVTGTEFEAGGPIFEQALKRVLDRVPDPNGNRTLKEVWEAKKTGMDGLGSGSDFVAFLDLAGTSSLDMGFKGAAFPYHSCYDNFDWMAKFGDPGFQYHQALGQIWALLILDMADRPLLPLNLSVYAGEVTKYVNDLETNAQSKNPKAPHIDFRSLRDAANQFVVNARIFEDWRTAWSNAVYESRGFESTSLSNQRIHHNNKMADFETDLLDIDGGLPGREQFKHIIYAPQLWNNYGAAYFPGVRDAMEEGEWELAQKQVDKAARILDSAAKKLLST
ncbi:MAG: hypothetical protein LQ341_002675 [Variospora aurantia]|nr:MAG: hypothetical protein LQ341_002675 [Variospora aurantia]